MNIDFILKNEKLKNIFKYQEFTKDDIDILNYYKENNNEFY